MDIPFSLLYENDSNNAYALATRQEEAQFGDLVFWVVMATFFAEENGISQASANELKCLLCLCLEKASSRSSSTASMKLKTTVILYVKSWPGGLIPRTGRNNLNL